MNIPVNQSRVITVIPVDSNGNAPAIVDGPNSWKIDATSVANGSTGNGPFFDLAVAVSGATATLTPTAVGGPSSVVVNNTANGAGVQGVAEFIVVGFAVALNLVVS